MLCTVPLLDSRLCNCKGMHMVNVCHETQQNMFLGLIAHRYKADGPITDARNADTTPEPLPTSRHTAGLHAEKENWFNKSTQLHKYSFYI